MYKNALSRECRSCNLVCLLESGLLAVFDRSAVSNVRSCSNPFEFLSSSNLASDCFNALRVYDIFVLMSLLGYSLIS
jgi:hypothetical protein